MSFLCRAVLKWDHGVDARYACQGAGVKSLQVDSLFAAKATSLRYTPIRTSTPFIFINQAQDYRNETIERDEPLSHALRKRTIKARKSVDGHPSNANLSRQFVPFRPAPDGLNVVLQITTENVPTFIISPACRFCFANKWPPSPNYGPSLQSLRPFLETYGLWL